MYTSTQKLTLILHACIVGSKERLSCKTYIISTCIFGLLLILLLGSLCSALMFALFKHDHDMSDSANVYGDVTLLSFHQKVDAWKYDKLEITVKPLHKENNDPPQIRYCQFDCTTWMPQYSIRPYNFTENVTRRKRHFAKFEQQQSFGIDNSLYMLKGSKMTFSVQALNPNQSLDIQLFIFTDAESCDDFYTHSTESESFKKSLKYGPYDTKNWDDGSRTILAPIDSYYCAVWTAPENTLFSYSTAVEAHYYPNTIADRNDSLTCSDSLQQDDYHREKTFGPFSIAGRGGKVATRLNHKTCVLNFVSYLVSDIDEKGPIEIEMNLFNSPLNIGFVLSLIFLFLLSLLLCIFFCVCFVLHLIK